MAKTVRNIGQEILDGLRELKRGEHGRAVNAPNVARIREKLACRVRIGTQAADGSW
jgi:hypothetical protein